MGFFKSSYTKEGPGVDKNAPKKAAFVVFLEIYSRKFWQLILANLLYALVSLPIVTVGLANAGLCYITRNFAREKHAFIAGDFFDTIRKNWKQALPVGIINLLLGVVLAYAVFFYFNFTVAGDVISTILLAIVFLFTLLYIFLQYYIYLMMITFKFTIKQLYKNSLIMAASCWKSNLIISVVMLLVYAAVGGIALLLPGDIAVAFLVFMYALLLPSFQSLLTQFCAFPEIKRLIIDPYYKDHPGEDKEKMRALGIDVEDDDTPQEAVFTDRGNEKRRAAEEAAQKPEWTFPTPHPGHQADDDDDTI